MIRAMPEGKRFFSIEVFPKPSSLLRPYIADTSALPMLELGLMPLVTTMSSPGEVLAKKLWMVLGVGNGNSQSKWTSPATVDTWRPLKTFSWESRPKVHQVVLAPPEFRVHPPSSAPSHLE